jgi:hypothetical protein
VGATRRFLGCCVKGFSDSLFSSFSNSPRFPSTLPELAVWEALGIGVWGGVVSGRGSVDGCAECAAVTDGTDPRVGVGLLTTPAGVCCEDCVATEQAELERAGLAGGIGPVFVVGKPCVLTGDGTCADVDKGVAFAAGVLGLAVLWPTEVGPVYTCPSSPGAKERVEQKPSEELMINVNPSVDLYSVRVGATTRFC